MGWREQEKQQKQSLGGCHLNQAFRLGSISLTFPLSTLAPADRHTQAHRQRTRHTGGCEKAAGTGVIPKHTEGPRRELHEQADCAEEQNRNLFASG